MDAYISYFARPETIFEILKTVALLIAALAIARLAVFWALARFKSEKAWERENAALADVLVALSELEEINYYRMREHGEDGRYTNDYKKQLQVRHDAAKAKLLSVSAVASLVLSSDLYAAFHQFESRLNDTWENDEPYIDYLEREASSLGSARQALLSASRAR